MAKGQALVVDWAGPSRRRWAQLLCVLQADVRAVLAPCIPSTNTPTCPRGVSGTFAGRIRWGRRLNSARLLLNIGRNFASPLKQIKMGFRTLPILFLPFKPPPQ